MSGWIFPYLSVNALAAALLLQAGGVSDDPTPETDGAAPAAEQQPDQAPVQPESPAPTIRAPQRVELDDPTRPSPPLQQALDSEAPPPPATGRQTMPSLPQVKLKARMVANGVAEAILEIDGTLHRVSEGEELMIASERGVVMVNVVELNGSVVRLEIPPLPGKLMLR